jgi:hypothetical protein
MIFNTPYYLIPTGYINATGSINFDINKLVNFDYIQIGNNIIYYNNEINSLDFFINTGSLLDNVNNNPDIYNVKLNLINFINSQGSTGQNIFIESLILGDQGNNILIGSNNTGIIFSNNTLQGGKNLYSILKKPKYPLNKNDLNLTSPLFSSNFSNRFYITGFYTGFATRAYLNGFIDSFLAVRNFEDIWNISTGIVTQNNLINYKSNNLFNGQNYYSNNQFNFKTPLKVQISYSNIFSLKNNLDIAEITIKDLNAPNDRLLSGINFRITGLF